MRHVEAMAERLPLLYRDGQLTRAILALPALQIEILDEEALDVKRAHWFDAALDLEDAARLAAILDMVPESWQSLGEFRAWVHTIRNARLRYGAVTLEALQDFVADYSSRYQAAAHIVAVPSISSWSDSPTTREAAFVENPPRWQYQPATKVGGVEPLHQFTIVQRGLDEAHAGFMLVGLPTAPESVPVIVNVTSGDGLVFLGNIPPGARLWLRPTDDGLVQGHLENVDVTDRLQSISGVVPGQPWDLSQVEQPARAVRLNRGKNQLWFLPVAHFDALGLDRFLLALPDLLLSQGRYDETKFDQALFYQHPAVIMRIGWTETQPARFEIRLPAGNLVSRDEELAEAMESRDRLDFSLNQGVEKLRAAGVASQVRFMPHSESQAQRDYLTTVLPIVHREVGPTGADSLPDSGGVFGVTEFNGSTFE